MILHYVIELFPRCLLSLHVFGLHVTNHNGNHFVVGRIVHMRSHSCLTSYMLHMIKHDLSILQIPYKLHSCDKTHSTPHTIYGHLETKHLLSKNLFGEVTLLDVVILILGFQFKDAINVSTIWTMLEKKNEVTNVGKVQFIELVLDLLQLLTFEKLHFTITTTIEQMFNQKGLASTWGNHKHLYIRHANDLPYNQPSSLLRTLHALTIHNKMVVYLKMNCHF